ncbi:TadE/TadG family type IV pilus assembly protein [Methylobacterium sp. sgz302541]|uniref:TadE/TadG family type IV pilus assembly protein n=1 Tax=unclassified Methylobacterium TaxID=2615210 RepID=UPI003D3361DA
MGRQGRSGEATGVVSAARALLDRIRRAGPDRRGSVAVMFGLGAAVLITLAGGGADYARLVSRRSQLQSAADAGALAGGNALKLAMSTSESIIGLVDQTIRAAANVTPERPITTQIVVAEDKSNVFAKVEEDVKLTFGRLLGIPTAKVAVKARANVVGKMRLCMLTLDPLAPGTFNLEKNAQVTALSCSLYSNSTSGTGMIGNQNSIARAETICSAGGYLGPRANFTPTPQTDCPAIKDPMAARPAPSVGPCKSLPAGASTSLLSPLGALGTGENRIENRITLEPGTYCRGLHITDNAVVTLKPGIYVIKDGPLFVDKTATLNGVDVGFYFTGDMAGLLFDTGTTVSLAAPTTGVMAGILMTEERTVGDPVDPIKALLRIIEHPLLQPYLTQIPPTPAPLQSTQPMRTYRIISDNTRTMLGTIYLPAGRLVIDGKRPVSDRSTYTVIVAQQVNLYEGPTLVLNANYDASSVPVPKGVGPVSGKLRLTQ